MNYKNRKKALASLTKEAEAQAKITKLAQEVTKENPSMNAEEYAKNLLKKILENTDITLVDVRGD
jgi:hypothetical protein